VARGLLARRRYGAEVTIDTVLKIDTRPARSICAPVPGDEGGTGFIGFANEESGCIVATARDARGIKDQFCAFHSDYGELNTMMYPMAFVSKLFPATLAGLILLSSCGDPKPGDAKTEAPALAALDPAAVATITGKVTFTGEKPAQRTLSMDAVPACANQHKGPIVVEDTIVNTNGTLKNVFVYVKSGLPARQWPVPKTAVALDQKGCVYSPRVLGVMTGQDLEITNNDPSMHNVHPLPKNNTEWNSSQAPKGEKMIKQFEKEDIMIPFKCNVHPWMKAYVGVVSHPFYAVTGDDGGFSLKGLPPGNYTLEAWHEKLGTQEIKVSVAAKDSKSADFSYKK